MKTTLLKSRATLPALFAGAFMLAGTTVNAAVGHLGNPYTPSGANYTITATQGINSTNGSGGTTNGAQVNTDFEFKGTLGVSYLNSSNKLTDFGIGLYTSGGTTLSTGLNIALAKPSLASSVSITLADFDITSTATFFNPNKVEPSILVFGANNTVLFSADPTAIFNAMKPSTGVTSEDYWDLNFGKLLTNAGQSADASISGFLLYADSTRGEKASSDPYFITAVSGGIPAVPEPRTYAAGAVLVALLILGHAKAVLKKKNESSLV